MRQGTTKEASQGPEFERAEYNVSAPFADMEGARKAMEALSQAGIEGQRITLRGPAAEEAAGEETTRGASKAPDARMMKGLAGRVAKWGSVGAVAGAIVAVPIGLLAIEAFGAEITLGSVILMALAGAIGLSLVFALVATYYPISAQEQAWELSYHDTLGGEAVVGVHSGDRRDIETATNILRQHSALVRESGLREDPQTTVDEVTNSA